MPPASALDLYHRSPRRPCKVTISTLTDARVLDFIATAHQENGYAESVRYRAGAVPPAGDGRAQAPEPPERDRRSRSAPTPTRSIRASSAISAKLSVTVGRTLTRFAAPSYCELPDPEGLELYGQLRGLLGVGRGSCVLSAACRYRASGWFADRCAGEDYITTVHNKYGTVNLQCRCARRLSLCRAIGYRRRQSRHRRRCARLCRCRGSRARHHLHLHRRRRRGGVRSRVLAHGSRGVGSGADRRRHRPDRVPAGRRQRSAMAHPQHHRPQRHTPRWRRRSVSSRRPFRSP